MRIGGYLAICATTAIVSPAQTFTTLANFDGTNGAYPSFGSLVQATNGNLYGTTSQGGTSNACAPGCGTIFKITPAGALITLHSFNSTDGANPGSELVEATNGYLYGTAYQGGLYNDGTIFRITPQGALTTLHNFAGSDGAGPGGGLVQAADGDLYGTTAHGGAFGNWGTIFKITPAGALTTLHSFDGADGGGPQAPLIQASDGDLYGTTYQGGASDDGTIFKITPAGALTVLHSFDWTDGAVLTAGLVQATNGDFYGTTNRGATNDSGTVFKITPAGALTTLHIFSGSDGAYPDGGLIQATNGNLYGTTVGGGGASNCTCGTIFEISPAGLTTLQSFDGSGGVFPYARLVQDTNGKLYGTTQAGETQATLDGTVFSLSLGLAPFVKTLPTVGLVGAAVKILGVRSNRRDQRYV